MSKEKLKIGILINSDNIRNWQMKIIEEIRNSTFAEITLVIKNKVSLIDRSSKFSKFINNKNGIVFQLHLKLDKLILGRDTDYFKTFDSRILLNDTNQITTTPVGNGFTNNFKQEDIKEIKNFNLDIILKFGFSVLTGDILNIPKYGIWSYESDNLLKSEPLGYWEVINKGKTTGSILQILNEDLVRSRVIHSSRMLTNYISISKNQNACYWRSATIIPRIIEGIYNHGGSYLLRLEKRNNNLINFHNRLINFHNRRFNKTTSSFTTLGNIFKHFWKVSKRLIQKIFFNDHWDVLYKINSDETFFPSLKEFKSLPTPADRFWADPFVISKDDKHYIFVEELLYKTNKGHIAVLELDNKGNFLGSKKVLERTYHLSYPFLFKCDDTYYMVPETGENKTIELYKCSEFPYKWEFVMNLMENIYAADATLFYCNNKWWLFCCMDKTGKNIGMLDELYLFFSDNLFTKNWQSHPNNPICTNTRTARPAGKIFIKNDKIYRPSQDCSGIYGRGININEIIKLSETEYEESVITKIIPKDDDELIGTHTFNFDDKITVIDGFKYKRRINLNKLFSANFNFAGLYIAQTIVSKIDAESLIN